MIRKVLKPFNVFVFDINSDRFKHYDVMPLFIEEYKKCKPKDKPKNEESLRKFIERNARYYFWSRCQWEIILVDFPCSKIHKKIDVYEQISMNLELFIDTFKYNINFKETKKGE